MINHTSPLFSYPFSPWILRIASHRIASASHHITSHQITSPSHPLTFLYKVMITRIIHLLIILRAVSSFHFHHHQLNKEEEEEEEEEKKLKTYPNKLRYNLSPTLLLQFPQCKQGSHPRANQDLWSSDFIITLYSHSTRKLQKANGRTADTAVGLSRTLLLSFSLAQLKLHSTLLYRTYLLMIPATNGWLVL